MKGGGISRVPGDIMNGGGSSPSVPNDPVLAAARTLRQGDLYPPQYRNVRWRVGDPETYPTGGKRPGRYPDWKTVQRRITRNEAFRGNPLPKDPIAPHRGTIPIDHIVPQRFNVLDPHNRNNLWINDSWGWLEHSFFDPHAKAVDKGGQTWQGPWQ